MKRTSIVIGMMFALLTGAVAQSFSYQGYLREGGVPANGTHQMTFRLYDIASGGIALGTVGPSVVNVTNGLFTQELDFGAVWNGSNRWLEIQVMGNILAPRVKINPTPYAHTASNTLGLQGRSVAIMAPANGQVLKWNGTAWSPSTDLQDAFWQANGSHIFYNGGNVGIGANTPAYPLHVTSSTSSRAIFGHASAAGLSAGVYGQNDSSGGVGVQGFTTTTTGTTYGVFGRSESTTGRGVYGYTSATTGSTYGVLGRSDSTLGRGVYGVTVSTTGTSFGVLGQSTSTSGRGVYGFVTASSGANFGVYGLSDSTSGYGVYSSGNFGASGTKSFRIDHPLDPENKYLHHYCTEGPEPQNVYNGVIRTGTDGYAWVQLPDYFEEINRDFRYQLTIVDSGDDFVLAKVTREIAHNRFQIRTSKPNVKVSWEVKAVRHDLFIRKNGSPIETDKPEHERGKYQHPELYDQPKERGINYLPEPTHENDKPQ
ncbi:MAG: hypothetical protein KIT45_13085 [Fimbriimonadia bacterium]|nr:hypothetical protein [Fimbriimonadia bacterium]